MFCCPLLQASLLLSKISPEIVGESLEANRFYDAVSCLMSYMVSTFDFFLLSIVAVESVFDEIVNVKLCKKCLLYGKQDSLKGKQRLVSCLNIISNTKIELMFSAVSL